MFLKEQEAGGETIAEFLAPRDARGGREAIVDEIEGSQQKQQLVRPLVSSTLFQWRDAKKPTSSFRGKTREQTH